MKKDILKFKLQGKDHEGPIVVPESLQEGIQLIGAENAFQCFMRGYIEDCKFAIAGRSRRDKVYKFKLTATQLQKVMDGQLSLIDFLEKVAPQKAHNESQAESSTLSPSSISQSESRPKTESH